MQRKRRSNDGYHKECKIYINLAIYLFALIGFVLMVGFLAINFGFTNTPGVIDEQKEYFQEQMKEKGGTSLWMIGDEWQVFKKIVAKDKKIINQAGKVVEINPRLIVAQLMVEQLRLFHTNRELFKTVFKPLETLGH